MRKPLALFIVLCASVGGTIFVMKIPPQEPTKISPQTEKPTGTVTDITYITLHTAPKDWNSDTNPDGFIIYITFHDSTGNPVRFENTEYRIRIKIFEAVQDSHGTTKGELLYDFCCPPIIKTNSHEVEKEGIEVFLNLSEPDQTGVIEVELEIQGIGVFKAVKKDVEIS